MSGKVLHIFITPNAGEPMQEVKKVWAIEQLGLEGDRYTGERGISSKLKYGIPGNISLIEQEAIDKANSYYPTRSCQNQFLPQDTRRNLVTKGISLNELVGKEFMIWGVKMRGVELCHPCFKEFFSGNGGLRAEILTSGYLYVGANISTDTYSCLLCGTTTSYPHVCPEFYPELR